MKIQSVGVNGNSATAAPPALTSPVAGNWAVLGLGFQANTITITNLNGWTEIAVVNHPSAPVGLRAFIRKIAGDWSTTPTLGLSAAVAWRTDLSECSGWADVVDPVDRVATNYTTTSALSLSTGTTQPFTQSEVDSFAFWVPTASEVGRATTNGYTNPPRVISQMSAADREFINQGTTAESTLSWTTNTRQAVGLVATFKRYMVPVVNDRPSWTVNAFPWGKVPV